MRNLKKYLPIILSFIFVLSLIFTNYSFARGGFSSSRSSGSSYRSSGGSSYRSSGSSKPAGNSYRSSNSGSSSSTSGNKYRASNSNSSGTTQRYKTTKAEREQIKSSKKNGNYFKNKNDAMKSFQEKNKNTYKNNFDKEPTTRPNYIPQQTTIANGTSVNVIYNPSYRGYGYMNNGAWIVYDVMTDIAMMNLLMQRQGYYVDTRPVVVHDGCFLATVIR